MPASSKRGRTAPPAITPVPSTAGLMMMRPAPKWPNLVRDGALLGHRHVEHVLLGIERRLGDGQGHLSGLAHANADVALAVANDDESDEAHATTTLDGLRHAVDVNAARLLRTRRPRAAASDYEPCATYLLELETGGTSTVGEGLDAAMVDTATAIEGDLGDGRPRWHACRTS